MKKLLLGITVLGLIGSCARWGDIQKDWKSDTSGLKRTVTLNLISENNRRVTIDNAIVITEEE